MRSRITGVLLASAWLALLLAPAAAAHSGEKAEPQIAASLEGQGLERTAVVRLTDAHDGDPIAGATVTVSASTTRPHPMTLAPVRLSRAGAGLYSGEVVLVMPARWTLKIDVTGDEVVSASATLTRRIELSSSIAAAAGGQAPLPTTIEDTLTRSDYANMAMLWIHGLAAMGWIIGVLVMAIALAASPTILDAGVRARLGRWYRRTGVWLHWALVPVIVATGIYNMLRVTPFSLVWTPSGVGRLEDIPYGPLYEAILIVKLALFLLLLVTATLLLVRTTRSDAARPRPPAGAARTLLSALGAAGVVYLVTVPLILGAAMALRYVHVLNHVAVVLSHRH